MIQFLDKPYNFTFVKTTAVFIRQVLENFDFIEPPVLVLRLFLKNFKLYGITCGNSQKYLQDFRPYLTTVSGSIPRQVLQILHL